jgi:hypothetical protein
LVGSKKDFLGGTKIADEDSVGTPGIRCHIGQKANNKSSRKRKRKRKPRQAELPGLVWCCEEKTKRAGRG